MLASPRRYAPWAIMPAVSRHQVGTRTTPPSVPPTEALTVVPLTAPARVAAVIVPVAVTVEAVIVPNADV